MKTVINNVVMKTSASLDIFLLYFCVCIVITQDVNVNDRNYEYFNVNFIQWNVLHYGIKEFTHLTKSVVVLDSTSKKNVSENVERTQDFKSHLLRYLNSEYFLPVMVMSSDALILSTCDNKCESNKAVAERFISDKVYNAVIYDSLESFNKTLHDSQWKVIYNNIYRSFFLLIVTNENLSGVSCEDENFKHSLKEILGDFFQEMFVQHGILKVMFLFPILCGHDVFLKYNILKTHSDKNYSKGVQILTEEDFKSNRRILSINYKNFMKYPLRVNIFERIPTTVNTLPESMLGIYLGDDIKDVGSIGGIDGFTLGNLIKALNFFPVISEPSDNMQYGRKLANGTFTGSIGDIISKRSDISMNTRFLKLYDTDEIEFTYPIYYDQFCVIAPKALMIPNWLTIFQVFSLAAWIVILVSVLVLAVLWWTMRRMFPQEEVDGRFLTLLLDTCLVVVSNPVPKLPILFRERLFITICMFFNLIIAGIFQGFLSTAYSTTSYYSEIDTLEQLDSTGMSILTRSTDMFGFNISKIGDRLSKKIAQRQGVTMDLVVNARDVVVVERRSDATMLIQLNYTDHAGRTKVHIVDECPRNYHLGYIVYKGFPFLSNINSVLQRFISAGLNQKWYSDTEYALLLKSRLNRDKSDRDLKLSIVDVQTSFIFLAMGLALSFVFFVFEFVKFKCTNRWNIRRLINDGRQYNKRKIRTIGNPQFAIKDKVGGKVWYIDKPKMNKNYKPLTKQPPFVF